MKFNNFSVNFSFEALKLNLFIKKFICIIVKIHISIDNIRRIFSASRKKLIKLIGKNLIIITLQIRITHRINLIIILHIIHKIHIIVIVAEIPSVVRVDVIER